MAVHFGIRPPPVVDVAIGPSVENHPTRNETVATKRIQMKQGAKNRMVTIKVRIQIKP
jgi:hypothetical protein